MGSMGAAGETNERGLHVHASTRLEDLLEHLVQTMADDPLPPEQDEVVLVPSTGMARWLERQLAAKLGICASVAMPFLAPWFRGLLDEAPHRPGGNRIHALSPEVLGWRLHRLLDDPALAQALERPRRYFAEDPHGRKQLQLAQRIAGCFDQYQLYRPVMLQAWERSRLVTQNPEEPWQAELWRALVGENLATPGALTLSDIAARLARGPLPPSLPPRVHVFGFSTLPRILLDLLAALGRHCRVDLLAFVPTFESMDEGTSENPLLAALCRQSGEFVELISGLEQQDIYRIDLLSNLAEPTNVLQHVQQGLRDRVEPGELGAIDPADESLLVHVAHSPFREMEILRDRLLHALAADKSLRPSDVLVLVADLEAYAPSIHAVFGPVESLLPYQVQDRRATGENPVVRALLGVFRLASSQWTSQEVLAVVADPWVRARFGLTDVPAADMQRWVQSASIRWGIDAGHRAEFQQPPDTAQTWRQGIDRLVLGTMTGEVDCVVNGILPVSQHGQEATGHTGAFVQCLEALVDARRDLQRPRAPSEWIDDTIDLMGALFAMPAEADIELRKRVVDSLQELARAVALAGSVSQPLSLAAWTDVLTGALDGIAGARASGTKVTFAALKPMRMVPARVLAVCGLGDSFPQNPATQPFDLLAADSKREPGSRNALEDGRQMFLEAILSARDQLILSYVGRSQRSQEQLVPSSVLVELLGSIDRCWAPRPGSRKASQDVTVVHPLQGFSQRYAQGDPRLFTYASLGSCTTLQDDRLVPEGFAAGARNALVACTLQELESFWTNPARHFLRHALGLRLAFREEEVAELEDFEDPTKPWELMAQLGETAVTDPAHARERLAQLGAMRATGGTQSPGWLGKLDHAVSSVAARQLAQRVGKTDGGHALAVRAAVCGVLVSTWMQGPASNRILRFEVDTEHLSAQSKLRAWIRHVVCNAAAVEAMRSHGSAAGIPVTTQVVMPSRTITLEPLGEEALACLEGLVEPFVRGHRELIPFFPRASSVLAKETRRGPEKSDAERLEEARKAFQDAGWNGKQPEGADPYVHLCWRGIDPFAEPWADETLQLARSVFGPMQASMREGAAG